MLAKAKEECTITQHRHHCYQIHVRTFRGRTFEPRGDEERFQDCIHWSTGLAFILNSSKSNALVQSYETTKESLTKECEVFGALKDV